MLNALPPHLRRPFERHPKTTIVFRVATAVALVAGLVACGNSPFGPDAAPTSGRVQAGRDFSCALDGDGVVRCWGRNHLGQLGDGTTESRSEPRPVAGALTFLSLGIHGHGNHACAVSTAGITHCWGENDSGQLGTGTLEPSLEPVPIQSSFRFQVVSAGWRFSCGITDTGAAYCWGRGIWGQLGDGEATGATTPVAVRGGHAFVAIQAGSGSHACGIEASGALYCWGLNWRGAIGATTSETCASTQFVLECATEPVRVDTRDGVGYAALGVGQGYACGIQTDGRGFCWGQNESRQLGAETSATCANVDLPSVPCSVVPIAIVGEYDLVTITAGSTHTCAVDRAGVGLCWGSNTYGQLGDGRLRTENNPPQLIRGNHVFRDLSAGASHTCGTTQDDRIYCWGINDHGQIGNDTTLIGEFPVRVNGA